MFASPLQNANRQLYDRGDSLQRPVFEALCSETPGDDYLAALNRNGFDGGWEKPNSIIFF